ncbi:MAG: hypothetical protein EKK48_27360 [Candidatus Melainabacteria bacterium]|nr:MAG: hypothetical protein EKK48_27360 [Candidatus Melainabacteria bacterium]
MYTFCLMLLCSPCGLADNFLQQDGSHSAELKSTAGTNSNKKLARNPETATGKSETKPGKSHGSGTSKSGRGVIKIETATGKAGTATGKAGTGSGKAHTGTGKSATGNEKSGTETGKSEQTAQQAYAANREMYAQMFLRMRATPDNPRGAKLIAALQKVALKYFRMPIMLVSESEEGGVTHLVYKATDPSVDLLISCNATKAGGEWVFTDHDFKGKNSTDVALDPFNAIASVFPQEISEITLGLTILGFGLSGCFVSAILLLIASFRVSVLWGLVTLCLPFGNLIFVVCRWREAKNPFLVGFISFVVTVIGALIPLAVLQSLNGVQKMLPDFVPGMDNEHTMQLIRAGLKQSKNASGELVPELNDDQTTQLIRNGFKNSPNIKIQRLN